MKSKGWDVADCEIYDKAAEAEKRKELGEDEYKKQTAEKRAKRGRSSRTFKTDAEADLQKALKEKVDVDDYIKVATKYKADLERSIEDGKRKVARLNEEVDSLESELAPRRAEYEKFKKLPPPVSPEQLKREGKIKKNKFDKNSMIISIKEYAEYLNVQNLYYWAQDAIRSFEEKTKAFYNRTVENLKKLLRIAEKERDEAIKERDKVLSKLDDTIADKEAYEEAFNELYDNVPEAKHYWDNREAHRTAEQEYDYDI